MRLGHYRPLFTTATPPNPAAGDWAAWEKLLLDDRGAAGDDAERGMRFLNERGFGTVSSALIALPAVRHPEERPRFRFCAHHPRPVPWHDIAV